MTTPAIPTPAIPTPAIPAIPTAPAIPAPVGPPTCPECGRPYVPQTDEQATCGAPACAATDARRKRVAASYRLPKRVCMECRRAFRPPTLRVLLCRACVDDMVADYAAAETAETTKVGERS